MSSNTTNNPRSLFFLQFLDEQMTVKAVALVLVITLALTDLLLGKISGCYGSLTTPCDVNVFQLAQKCIASVFTTV